MERVVCRKIILTEGVARTVNKKGSIGSRGPMSGGPQMDERKVKRIMDKSSHCGVSLSADEARSVSEFVSSAA